MAENLGVKFAKWDIKDGYDVPRDCYNSYFYIVEDEGTNILEKFKLHGREYTGKLDGRIICLLHLFRLISGVILIEWLTGKPKSVRIW